MLKTGWRNLNGIAVCFLLCGILRVPLRGADFFQDFSLLFCGAFAAWWGLSVQKRVTSRPLRRLLVLIAGALLLFLTLQTARFSVLAMGIGADVGLDRYLWYGYYISRTSLPVLCLMIALRVNRPAEESLPRWVWILPVLAALMALGVLTNDAHFAFVSFPGSVWTDNTGEKHGWLYYVIALFMTANYAAAFLTLVKKARSFQKQRDSWLPLIPMLVALVYFILYPLNIGHRILGFRLWNIGEMLTFCLIGALEACIQVGLIPANTDYERIFPLAGLSAVIKDGSGTAQYTSAPVPDPMAESENMRILTHLIPGGTVEQAVDVSAMNALNRELELTGEKLAVRNEYLTAETRVKAERAEVESRNALYNRVVLAVEPQADQMNALLDDGETSFDEKIRRITLISAYIKRRANMELVAESGTLPVDELALAIRESLDILRLCGIQVSSSGSGARRFPAALLIGAYSRVEAVLEDCLDTLTDLMVLISFDEKALTVRLMLTADSVTVPKEDSTSPDAPQVSVSKDGRDMILAYTFRRWGEAA